jgi:hypothetical protein
VIRIRKGSGGGGRGQRGGQVSFRVVLCLEVQK